MTAQAVVSSLTEGGEATPLSPQRFEALLRELEALPEGVRAEIVPPGRLRRIPAPGAAHQWSARWLWHDLEHSEGLLGRRRWWLEHERNLKLLGQLVLVPDVCGWRLQPGEPVPPPWTEPVYIERVPHWVAEVLSASTASFDQGEKAALYARAGVEWLWLLEPEQRWVRVMRLRGGGYQQQAEARGEGSVLLPPFEEPLRLGRLWRPRAGERQGEGAGR